MSQLSRPYQIALAAIVVLALAWFLVLRPSDDDSGASGPLPGETTGVASSAPKAPGQQGLENAVGKANGAVDRSEAAPANDLADGATTTTASARPASPSQPATAATGATATAAAAPAADEPPADASEPLLAAVGEGKVAAILFYNPRGADDRATRRALLAVDRRGGRLVVRAAPIGDVARYEAITEGAQVTQSPTLLVFGPAKQARRMTGYADSRSIDQLVGDVGGPAFVSTALTGYAAKLGNVCRVIADDVDSSAGLTDSSSGYVDILSEDLREAVDRSRALEVPKRYRAFDRTWRSFLTGFGVELRALDRRLGAGVEPTSAIRVYRSALAPSIRKLDAAAAKVRIGC